MPARCIALLIALATAVPAQTAASAPDDPILAQLPANTTSVLVVRDLMPHVDTLLGSQPVRDLLAATGDLQQELLGMRLDAAALQKQIGLFRGFVPVEVVVAGSEHTAASVMAAVEALLAIGLLPMLAGQQDAEELVEAVRARVAAALPTWGATELLAWVITRDERTAEQWYDMLAEAAAGLPAGDGLAVAEQAERLVVRLRPLSAFGGAARQRLARVGIEVPAGTDPELVAVVEQKGDRLQLCVGRPATGPLAAERLGPLWASRPSPCVFAKVDLGEQEERAYELMEQIAGVAERIDDGAIAARLLAGVAQFESSFVDQTVSLVVGETVALTRETDGGEGAAGELDLPDPGVVRCLASDDGPFVLSALSLDVSLLVNLNEVVMRMGRRGRLPHEALLAAHEFLAGEESAVFAPGTLIVTRPAACRSVAQPPLGPMPFAALAVVARAHSDAHARDFVHALTGHLVPDLGDDDDAWPTRDLGVGVPTFALDLARVLPQVATAGLDADFAPHWCVVDGLLIVSTDPNLTTDLLARARGEAKPDLPARGLIDWTRWSGDHWGGVCTGLAAWWRAVPAYPESLPPPLRRFDAVLDIAAALAPSVEDIEIVTELDGATLRQVSRLRLRQPK